MSNPDPVLTAESLLRYEPFVRAVARGLLANEDEVQDLVQETWVRALDRPPRHAGAIKAWLARVTRNLALNRYRGEDKRRDRERTVARPEAEEIDVSQSRLEVHRKVVDAVLALEEPYRGVAILAYYQDLTPARIAARLGRPPGTVRSQLSRAHEILRRRMDAEFGGDRGAWCALLLPMVAPGAGPVGPAGAVGQPGFWRRVLGSLGGKMAVVAALVTAVVVVRRIIEQGDAESIDAARVAGLANEANAAQGETISDTVASWNDNERVLLDPEAALTVVVRDGSGVFEGADVWLLDARTLESSTVRWQVEAMRERFLDPAELFADFGIHGRSDADGEVTFSWSGTEGSSVLASASGLQAVTPSSEIVDGRLIVELQPVPEVRVAVVDSEGRPQVGAPVALRVGVSSGDGLDLFQHRTQAPGGETTFRDFVGKLLWNEGGEPSYSVHLTVPGAARRAATFDPARPATGPIRLALDPTGPLEVRAVDTNGKLLALDGTVEIGEPGAHQSDTMPTLKGLLRGGVARFEHVGVGARLKVRLHAPEQGLNWTATGSSSARTGQLARIEVVAPRRPRVAGRALDAAGEPLATATLHLSVCSEELDELQRTELRTDDEGRFRAQLEGDVPVGSRVRIRLLRWGYFRSGAWDGRADLDPLLTIGEDAHELGDLVLRDVEGLIRGRCVDALGAPIAGLRVSAKQDCWKQSCGDTTDAGGRFELSGLWPAKPVLELHSDHWILPEDPSLVPGDEERRIVLREGGRITGQVLTDAGMDPSELSLVLYDESLTNPAGTDWSAWSNPRPEDGAFDLGGLAPGTYVLKVSRGGLALLEAGGIDVAVGMTTVDSRLQGIDLRGVTARITLDVRTESGAPIRSAFARVYANGEQLGSGSAEEGRLSLEYLRSDHAVVLVTSHNCAPALVEVEGDPSEVVLRRGLEVTLYSRQRPMLAEGERTVRLSLVRPADDPRLGDEQFEAWVPSTLASAGEAEVVFPGPGTYRLHYSISQPASEGMVMASGVQLVAGDYLLEVRASDAGGSLDILLPDQFFD